MMPPSVPSSIRLVWDDRPALALSEIDITLLIDFAGPRFLEALQQLHENNFLDHRKERIAA
jgi:hypothetical protein